VLFPNVSDKEQVVKQHENRGVGWGGANEPKCFIPHKRPIKLKLNPKKVQQLRTYKLPKNILFILVKKKGESETVYASHLLFFNL